MMMTVIGRVKICVFFKRDECFEKDYTCTGATGGTVIQQITIALLPSMQVSVWRHVHGTSPATGRLLAYLPFSYTCPFTLQK